MTMTMTLPQHVHHHAISVVLSHCLSMSPLGVCNEAPSSFRSAWRNVLCFRQSHLFRFEKWTEMCPHTQQQRSRRALVSGTTLCVRAFTATRATAMNHSVTVASDLTPTLNAMSHFCTSATPCQSATRWRWAKQRGQLMTMTTMMMKAS